MCEEFSIALTKNPLDSTELVNEIQKISSLKTCVGFLKTFCFTRQIE